MAAAKRPAKRVASNNLTPKQKEGLYNLAKAIDSGLRRQKLTPGSAEWNKAFKDTANKLKPVAKAIADQPTLRAEKKAPSKGYQPKPGDFTRAPFAGARKKRGMG